MSYFWITFLVVYAVMLAVTCTATQSLADRDVTKEVLHRLDVLERQVKEQHVEIETLRGENAELKILRKYDSDIFRGQYEELRTLRKENVQLAKEINSLKERDTQLVARMNLLENRDKDMAENVNPQPQIYHETGTIENNVRSNAEKYVQDVKTDNGDTADDNEGIVSAYQGKADSNRIRRHSEAGQIIAFFATRSSSHAEHLGQHQNVVFDRAVTNIGDGYHNTTGIFTAPISGVYVFATTILAYNEAAYFDLVVNGVGYAAMYVPGTEVYETLSQTVILHIAKGQDVSIQSRDSDKFVNGYGHSTFSGFLLVSTEDNAFVG